MVFRRCSDWLILLLPYWLRHRRNTEVLSGALQSQQATLGPEGLCRQPGHTVSAADIWWAGISNCLVSSYHTQERFSSFKTCFTTTSDFWILSSYSLILWKKLFVFPRRVTLGTRIFICSNYYSLKFRMCVGSKIPISHSHKQMMLRLLPRAAAAGKQNQNVNESTQKSQPADGSSSRVWQSTEWLSDEEATSW